LTVIRDKNIIYKNYIKIKIVEWPLKCIKR
jgi:hypothetical protein